MSKIKQFNINDKTNDLYKFLKWKQMNAIIFHNYHKMNFYLFSLKFQLYEKFYITVSIV